MRLKVAGKILKFLRVRLVGGVFLITPRTIGYYVIVHNSFQVLKSLFGFGELRTIFEGINSPLCRFI